MGRARELAITAEALDRLTSGAAPMLVIAGEAGIGKTRMLLEIAELARRRGFVALRGAATEMERPYPFGVVVDALDRHLGDRVPAELGGLTAEQRGLLADVFPTLSGLRGAHPTELPCERWRTHHAIRVLLERLGARRPLALLLDDVHWADEASLELIAHLARRPPDAPVLLAVTTRPAQTPPLLDAAFDDAERGGPCARMLLEPLTIEEAEALLDPTLEPEARRALHRESGGNPFYLEQLARADPAGRDGWLGRSAPAGIVRTVQRELAGLSERTRLVAAAAAVVGDPVGPDLTAIAADLGEADAARGLDELCERDLIRPDEERLLRFRHPIVRRAVYDDAAPAWLIGAHRRTADALAARRAPATLRAHHEERSARIGDEQAIAVLEEAAAATVRLAPAMAARWLRACLRLLPGGAEQEPRRLVLQYRRAAALVCAGRLEEAQGALQEAVRATPVTADRRARALAALALVEVMLGNEARARAALVETRDALQDRSPPDEALLQHELALFHEVVGEWDSAVAHAARAERCAQEAGEPVLVATAAALRAVAEHGLGRIASARCHARRAARLLGAAPDRALTRQIGGTFVAGMALLDVDRYAEALHELERGLAVALSTRREHALVPLRTAAAFGATQLGRLDRASDHTTAAVELASLIRAPLFTALADQARCFVALRAGDLRTAVAAGEDVVEAVAAGVGVARLTPWIMWLAEALVDAGQPERARAQLLEFGGVDLRRIEPPHRALAGEILTRAEVALGEAAAAPRWADLARAEAAPLGLSSATAAALRATAHARLTHGDATGAAAAALRAASASARTGARLDAARARLLAGTALAAAAEPSRSAHQLEHAHAELHACGARRQRDEAAAALRKLGRPVPPPGGRVSGHDIALLSDREAEVAALVHDRLTNRQIAERLVLSDRTIETHIRRIFVKLGVRSRVELARAWERAHRLD